MPQDDLFDLIHSLSKTEKRYFKVFAGKLEKKERKKYEELFDAVNSMSEYDGELLRDQFPNLAPAKTKLIQQILLVMRSYHAGKDRDVQLADLLFQARFLRGRKLYSRSMKVLKKARDMAEYYQKWDVLLEVNKVHRMIIKENQDKGYAQRVEVLKRERLDTMAKIQLEMAYFDLVDPLLLCLRERRTLKSPEDLAELKAGTDPALMDSEAMAPTFSSRSNFYFAKYLYAQLQGHYDEGHEWQKKIVSWWDAHAQMKEINPYRYKIVLSNFLNSCHSVERYEDFPGVLEKIRSIRPETLDEEAEDFQNLKFLELLYCINTGRFEEGDLLVPEIEKGLKQFADKINTSRRIAFQHNICVLFFVLGKWRAASNWLKLIPVDPKISVGMDIQNFSFIFRLILDYQSSGEVDSYALRNVKRSLMRRKAISDFEKRILDLFSLLLDVRTKKERQMYFLKSLEWIEAFSTSRKGESTFGLTEVSYWLRSNAQSKSIREIFGEEGGER